MWQCSWFPHFGQLGKSWIFHFYAHVALSGPLFGWFRNSCGLLSSFQVLILSHNDLGISSSTASQLLTSTGRTRKFRYHSWFDPHLVVCFWGGRFQFSSWSFHPVCVVSVAHNFTELDSGRTDYGYLAFGELSRFVYCLLQKVKQSSDLPVIEKWEAYMFSNHSRFGAIAEEHFLEGTRLLASLEKINSSFLRKEFRRDSLRFLEYLVSTIFSTVAARSPIGQGLSCFCPQIIIGGDNCSAFHLFEQLLDGLLELGWIRGSEVEPAKAEFQFFVREQLQVETSSNRSRALINSVFAFCNQPSFRSRRNLKEVGMIALQSHLGVLIV